MSLPIFSNLIPPHPPRVAVVGGGVGGLTTAALLARAGCRVVLFEKNDQPGGKLGWEEEAGYSWDTGPSLLTMPHVLEEVWEACGKKLEDDLELVRLPSTCRYRWRDGTVLDEDETFWEDEQMASFLKYAKGLNDISAEAFLRNRIEDAWKLLVRPDQLGMLRHFPKISSQKTLSDKVDSLVKDPHLRQILHRFATYNGSSPYKAPSAFNIIPYVQRTYGGWYVKGGLIGIPQKLAGLAESCGAEIRTGTQVESVLRDGRRFLVSTGEGEKITSEAFDTVVCNQDVLTASRGWMGQLLAHRGKRVRHPRPDADISMSGFVLMLGMDKTFPELDHHNILFSDDYPREFQQLFDEAEPADDPTIYIAVTSKNDPEHAPEGGENWFVLVNAPANPDPSRTRWAERAEAYGDLIIQRIGEHLGAPVDKSIVARRTITPDDFASRHLSFGGALYGYASHGVTSSFRRPSMEPRGMPGLYCVGGTTHPGGGIPLAMLGARITTRRILKRHRAD